MEKRIPLGPVLFPNRTIPKMMRLRQFEEGDADGVILWWHNRLPSLHLVALEGDVVVAHLQVADVGHENRRRRGEINMILRATDAWNVAALDELLQEAKRFAIESRAKRLTAAFVGNEPLGEFLLSNGFRPYEQYQPLTLDLSLFDPNKFATRLDSEISFTTYAAVGDTPDHRWKLFELECATRADQPFRHVGDYVPVAFKVWCKELDAANHDEIFIARQESEWVGLVRDLNWCFTGVHPGWRGRGIATALKVRALTVAKQKGLGSIETENHEDNQAMLAVNRKLGFQPGSMEINCELNLA